MIKSALNAYPQSADSYQKNSEIRTTRHPDGCA
jgi:hypothetical protein